MHQFTLRVVSCEQLSAGTCLQGCDCGVAHGERGRDVQHLWRRHRVLLLHRAWILRELPVKVRAIAHTACPLCVPVPVDFEAIAH